MAIDVFKLRLATVGRSTSQLSPYVRGPFILRDIGYHMHRHRLQILELTCKCLLFIGSVVLVVFYAGTVTVTVIRQRLKVKFK